MASAFGRQTTRSSSSTAGGSKTTRESSSSARPSMLSKAYNSVSFRASKANRASLMGNTAKLVEDPDKKLNSFAGVFPTPEPGCRPDPPAKLTKEEDEKYQDMLTFFKNSKDFPVSLKPNETKREPANEWEKCRMLTRESLLRYLRATKWDVPAAKKRLTETIAWRREFGVDNLDPDEMEKEAKSGKETVLGYDNKGRPLHYMHPHRNDTKESPRQMQFAVWILETAIDLMPPGIEQLALLINFDHRSRNPTSIANAKLMLYILQNHYVERLGIALCINVPWVFKMFWNAIQPFIDPVTKSKCKFDEAIKSEVPTMQLSGEFGGELDPKYDHEAYWSDLVHLSNERRRAMLRRFSESCHEEIGASEWIIRGGADKLSPFNVQDREAVAKMFPESETTTLKNSDGGSTDPEGGSKARQQAIDASGKRFSGTNDEPETPMEQYRTPTDSINSNPLERQFSNVSAHAALAAGVVSGTPLGMTVERPQEEMESHIKRSEPQTRTRQGSVGSTEEKGSKEQGKELPRTDAQEKREGWQHMENEVKESFEHLKDKVHESKAWKDFGQTFHKRNSKEHRKNSKDGEEASTSSLKSGEADVGAGNVGIAGSAAAAANNHASHDQGAQEQLHTSNGYSKSVSVLFFAAARDASGTRMETIDLPNDSLSLSDLVKILIERCRSKSEGDADMLSRVLANAKWSVEQTMVDDEDLSKTILKGGEEVAIIPPVSGG